MVGPFGMAPRGTMSARALRMAQALAAKGHVVRILMPPWQNPEDSGRVWDDSGVTVENVALPLRLPGLFHALTAVRLARRALALRPDVVHLFKPKAYSGVVHMLLHFLPRSVRPRLVVDADDWEGAGGWNTCADYPRLMKWLFAQQEHWGLTHGDAVTVASRTLQSLVWALGVDPERVHYVPNGVSAASRGSSVGLEYQPLKTRGSPVPDTILLYSRFFEFPVSRVLEVFRKVRALVPSSRLVIAGKGLAREEDKLLDLLASEGLQVVVDGRVSVWLGSDSPYRAADAVYLGWVAQQNLEELFSSVTLSIYPFDDTLINRCKCAVKLLDLMAAAVPVVAEAVGQNTETIRHEETGLLVQSGDTDAFAQSVVRLLRQDVLRTRLATRAAQDVRDRYSWSRLAGVVELAYGAES
jgi:glycosyltransferase involved in cell wall biosynthesis